MISQASLNETDLSKEGFFGYRVLDFSYQDLGEVMKIERASFPSPWTREAFINEMNNKHTRIRVIKFFDRNFNTEMVVGYIVYWMVYDELHIQNIAIHPLHRRKGLATYLLKETIGYCNQKGGKIISLEVRRSNSAAISLYMKNGFSITGVRRKYYWDNYEDALIMELTLSR
jgi:ribosomal-protein-alanine N-acetyltransferase